MTAASPLGDPVLAGVALREDDAAVLALAGELARLSGAPLTLVHAHPYQALIPSPPPDWEREREHTAAREVSALAADAGAAWLCRPNPSPVRALHEAVEEAGAGLLVVGSSHRGAAGRVLPGGVAERLLHAAPCVVAIAPRGYAAPTTGVRRIGLAYAGGPGAPQALDLAMVLARAAGGRVTALSVGDEAASAEARARIGADLLETATVLHGDPAGALAAATADLDLLVTGAPHHGSVRSLLLGGVTRALAHAARCPLLILPPTRS